MTSSSSSVPAKRNFVVEDSDIGYRGGKCSSDKSGTPLSAARRAAKVLFMMAENKQGKAGWKKYESSADLIKFTIRESTRGSDKATFQYEAKKKELKAEEKKTIKRGNAEYMVEHKIVVRAAHFTPIPRGGAEDEF